MTRKEILEKTIDFDDAINRIVRLEKENAELKADNDARKFAMAMSEKVEKQLREENAELKEKGDKWFVFETEAGNWGMDKATQSTVDRHNYFYGTKEECQKWGVEHKIKDYTGHKYCYDRIDNQLTKAKELLAKWVELFKPKGGNIPPTPIQVDTEQFLNEVEK